MSTLISLNNLPDLVELGPLNTLLEQLFPAVFESVEITNFFESQEQGVNTYNLVLALNDGVVFPVPGLSGIELGIFRQDPDRWPVILCEMVYSGGPPGITLRYIPLRVVIANPLLLPVVRDESQPSLPGFAFEIEGTVGINAALEWLSDMQHFSIPAFTVQGTGMVFALEHCRLVLNQTDADTHIDEQGFDADFRGIHAETAQFHWDVPVLIANEALPGIRAQLHDLTLGNQGLTVDATMTWAVVEDGRDFNLSETELLFSVFDSGWQGAAQSLQVQVLANTPVGTRMVGHVRIPFFAQIVQLTLQYQAPSVAEHQYELTLSQGSVPFTLTLGHEQLSITLNQFALSGHVSHAGDFVLSGQLAASLSLPGVVVQASLMQASLEHADGLDRLLINLTNITVEGIGLLEQAQLVMVFTENGEQEAELTVFELVAEIQWQAISQRISLTEQADWVPLPPDDAQLTMHVSWQNEQMKLSLSAQFEDVDHLWPFIPQAWRPDVSEAHLGLTLIDNADEGFDAHASIDFLLRLPEITGLLPHNLDGFVELTSGGEDGFTELAFLLHSEQQENGEFRTSFTANIDDPVMLALQLPGLKMPQPPLNILLQQIDIAVGDGTDSHSGQLTLTGEFTLIPILPNELNGVVPPLIAQQLDQLLGISRKMQLSGSANMTLGMSGDNAWFDASCEFAQAELELDLFDMLVGLLGGQATMFDDDAAAIDLDIDIRVVLKALSLQLGSDNLPADAQGVPFSFGMQSDLEIAGQTATLELVLSDQQLRIGLAEATIPIAIPKLPLSLADLDKLNGRDGRWNYQDKWLTTVAPDLEQQLDAANDALQLANETLETLIAANDEAATFQQQFRIIPALQRELFQLAGRKFLYQAILSVHQILETFGVQGSQHTYQAGVEVYQGAVDVALGWLHADTQLQFRIRDAMFVLPFNDPADIRVEGGASIIGFAPDDPLAALSALTFTLGISADAIYFAVEGGAGLIPLPDFGRYPGSAVRLDKLALGYGYSKNSLHVDFAGELILSAQLVEEADTSSVIGVGVRLPTNNSLKFKLDLIPITLGEVEFVLPLIAFDIDLRSVLPIPAPVNDGLCQPHWDGLELIAPARFRADFKRLKLSPLLGPIPLTNITASFDFQIGDKHAGISHICDNYFVLLPASGSPPIPLISDAPFFDRYCTRIYMGGFGVSFDLTRPFPHPSPLLIFELLGFISDPSLPIDPNGHIANIMYAQLHNGRISVPPSVAQMFPVAGAVVNKNVNERMNVATLIALGQQIEQCLQRTLTQAKDTTLEGIVWIRQLPQQFTDFSPAELLSLLPDDLRYVSLNGRFVHFDASATFCLENAAELGRDAPKHIDPVFERCYHQDFSVTDLSGWQTINYGLKRGKGDWQVKNGTLWQYNNVGDNSPARYGAMLVNAQHDIGDMRLQVTATSADDDGFGVIFHFQDKDTFYRFRMTQQQQQWDLIKIDGGTVTELHQSQSKFTAHTPYKVVVECTSRPQGNTGFNRRLSARHTGVIAANSVLVEHLEKAKNVAWSTRINVWVNGALWCDITDSVRPLTHGYTGLDCWWNEGMSFDSLQLWQRIRPNIAMGQPISPKSLPALASHLSDGKAARSQPFSAFSDDDIHVAMKDAVTHAVVVVARVRLFESQQVRMLGWISMEGRFLLVSELAIDSLQLPVAGIERWLGLALFGRLTLTGQKAGAESWARFDASVYADWHVLGHGDPSQALARLKLGSDTQPVMLSVTSERTFIINGEATLYLFAGQLRIDGQADISDSHVMVAGELRFEPDIYLFGTTHVMQLDLQCQGRVGPGAQLDISGSGEFALLGKAFSTASIRISERSIEIAAVLAGSAQHWQLAGLVLSDVIMSLDGQLDFADSGPNVQFAGEGGFAVLGARIEGRCRIEANTSNWLVAAEGALFWQGRNWLDGSIAIANNRITFQGKADFGLDLSPQLPANIELAGLYFNASVSGRFELTLAGQLVAWKFDINWQLGVKLPGMDAHQLFPVAAQQFKVQGSHAPTDTLIALYELINIDGLTLFDLGSVILPIPHLDESGGKPVYLHSNLSLDVDGEGASFTFLTPIKPEPSSPVILGFLYEDSVEINVPEVSIPIPVLSDEPTADEDPFFVIPTPTIIDQSFNLGQVHLDDVQLHIRLAWQAGELGVLMVNSGEFVAFNRLMLFPIGLIGMLNTDDG